MTTQRYKRYTKIVTIFKPQCIDSVRNDAGRTNFLMANVKNATSKSRTFERSNSTIFWLFFAGTQSLVQNLLAYPGLGHSGPIGNVQFWFTSWQFCPLDGVLIITPSRRFLHRKNSWKFAYIQATHYRTPFILTRFCTENSKFHLTPSSGNFRYYWN